MDRVQQSTDALKEDGEKEKGGGRAKTKVVGCCWIRGREIRKQAFKRIGEEEAEQSELAAKKELKVVTSFSSADRSTTMSQVFSNPHLTLNQINQCSTSK